MYFIIYNNIYFLLEFFIKKYKILLYHILYHFFRKIYNFMFTFFVAILKYFTILYLNFNINI